MNLNQFFFVLFDLNHFDKNALNRLVHLQLDDYICGAAGITARKFTY